VIQRQRRTWISTLLRLIFWVLLVILVIALLAALFINYKKNELASRLLDEANSYIEGEIAVGSIKIGRLLDYPDLQIELNDVRVYPKKRADTITEPFISVSQITIDANLDEIINGNYRLKSAHVNGGEVTLYNDDAGELAIASAFEPILPDLMDTTVATTGTFALAIDTILISDYAVHIADAQLDPTINVQIDSLRANFNYAHSLIEGTAVGWGKTDQINFDSTSSITEAPLHIHSTYTVALTEKRVAVKATELSLFYSAFSAFVAYDYGDFDELNLDLKSTGKGISLQSQNPSDSTDVELANLIGFVDMQFHLNWQARLKGSMLDQLYAQLELEGRNIHVIGIDLDNYIDNYKRSQNFNLLDMSALLLAGPAGIAITKGRDYTLLLTTQQGDSSIINHLVADWILENGKLTATDLAFNTASNLVAASCAYQVDTDSLDMNIMVIDRRGCTMLSQGIYGTGEDLKSSRVKVIKTLMGPVTNFFRDIGLGKCKTAYAGRVKHPNAKEKKKKKKNRKKAK
jgi:hypothetical protein